MSQKLTVIDSLTELQNLKTYLKNKEFIAYDTETTGVLKTSEVIGFSVCADENEAFYVILSKWDAQNNRLIYQPKEFNTLAKEVIETLVGKNILCHNAVFDCMITEAYFNVSLMPSIHTDTMLLAHIINENRRVGLKELAKEYFGESEADEQREMKESVIANGGKLTKKSYEMYKADPYLMGKYGAKDALLTFKLFIRMVPDLYEQGLDKFFYEEESMPLLKNATYQLNTVGLKVDGIALTTLKKTLEAECLEDKAFIMREIQTHIQEKYPGTNKKNQFNIGASQQLSWLLFGKLGLEFATLTKGGKKVCKDLGLRLPYTYSAKKEFIHACETSINPKYKNPFKFIACDKKTLSKFAKKLKWVHRLQEYNKRLKLLNTYVEGIEERMAYGIIQPSFLQHGTSSGRYSSRNPNFQNLPRDDKRIKACIVARPGKVFVGADYSQLEPRVFAYFSKDQRLLEAFQGQDDFYSVIGMEVYSKYDCTPRKDGSPDAFGVKYKKYRDMSKTIALATTYGATAFQLAPTTGKSVEETQEDIDAYFERFPGVANMMQDSHKEAKANGAVYSLFGRPRRIPEATRLEKLYGKDESEYPYEARTLLNLSVNHKIQSTGASIVNRAAIRFLNLCKEARIAAALVLQVHDSLIAECRQEDAEDVKTLLQEAMENTTKLEGIRLEAEPKIGKNLSEV